MEHLIVLKWDSPLLGLWLAAGTWVEVFLYKYQLDFSQFAGFVLLQLALFLSACWTLAGTLTPVSVVILHLLPLQSRVGSGLWGGMSSFKPGWLCGSSLDNARGEFCPCYCRRLSCVWCYSSVQCLWHWCRGLGKALGMGTGIVGVSSFLRNRRFRKVILPDPSTLIHYKCCYFLPMVP